MSSKTTRHCFRTSTLIAATSGLMALGIGTLAAGPAAAVPSSNLVFSVDGGTTWSANVNAAPGQTVIAREYYDNDTSATIAGASVTTSLPSGFTLVAGSTEVCLNPGTTDPTNPTSELECNTQTGGAPPNDEGGPIVESSVWSGSNLTISPTAGLFGQPTNGTAGPLAMGKTKFLNLDYCDYTNDTDDYSTTVDPSGNPPFDAATNTSDTATAVSCGAGTGGYHGNGFRVENSDLLGQSTYNLEQCDYVNATPNNFSIFVAPMAGTIASNSAATAPTCGPIATPGYGFVSVNSGVEALDLLDNRYVNLDQCVYVHSPDIYTADVDTSNAGGAFDTGTDASNTPQTADTCGAGAGGYAPSAANNGFIALDTLDTTRGQGFVQWSMTAPTPGTTTTYTEDGQLTGSGTGDPTTSGTITIDASVGTPLANAWVIGGGLGALGLATAAYVVIRRRRTPSEA
jgi:hypothetical protein